MENLFQVYAESLDGQKDFLKTLTGKVVLVVNTVSKFGYTPQCSTFWSYARTARNLWQLQQVHDEFKDRGFSVLGVPCNQFGRMEPGNNSEISEFIKKAYPFVTFPFLEKMNVNGKDEHELYSFLKGKEKRRISDTRADNSQEALEGWNVEGAAVARIPHSWEKFIISRNGQVITRFNWQAMPLDEVPLTTGESWTIRECIDEILG